VHESTILSPPPPRPPALPTLVQYHCTIIRQYMTPTSNSGLHAIHHTILVITVSCKHQYEWARRVCGGLSSALGVTRCGRSAGCVLCVLWAMSAAVLGRGVPCGGKHIITYPYPTPTLPPTLPVTRGGPPARVSRGRCGWSPLDLG